MKVPNLNEAGILFVKDLSEEIKLAKPLVEGLLVRKMSDKQDLYNVKINENLKDRIKINFCPNKEIFIGLINNEVVHTSFVDYGYPAGVMFFGCFTLPALRGKHISSSVKTEIFQYLKIKGIKKAYISCSKNNVYSYKAILRAGFRKINLWQKIIIKLIVWLKKTK
jgi:RimJ/RimL family protein N-acetyltransferase